MNVFDRMTFFAKLYGVGADSGAGMWYLYITIVILCAIVYKLGFAKKLKVWMNVIIYTVLVVFCLILTFFAVFLPITEILVISAIVLGIYKIRLHQFKGKEPIEQEKEMS